MTDVSVVIPTRDRPGLLALTMSTALWQKEVDAEVLVTRERELQSAHGEQ